MDEKYISIEKTIDNGVAYLISRQKEDGRFSSITSHSQNFSTRKETSSVFPTCLILSSLSSLSNSGATKKIKDKSVKFLLGQRSDYWSWNYWKRNSLETKNSPYPDDLDDTSCALSAIWLTNPESIKIKDLTKIINLLTFGEVKEGGPYYTWLVFEESSPKWKDIDAAVNSNIAYFLSLQEVTLPNLISFTEKTISECKYYSPYYYSYYSVIYFISRWYRGKKKKDIINYLLGKKLKNNSWGNPLDTSLAISSLLNFGFNKLSLEKSINYLLETQQKGIWKTYPLVVEKIEKGKKYYAGSSELTTAFCLEALSKFINGNSLIKKKEKNKISPIQKRIVKKILRITHRRFMSFSPELKEELLKIRDKIITKDRTKQIKLLPYFFAKTLRGKNIRIKENLLIQLGVANLYGWMAYTIYDDFYDAEGEERLLPLANIVFRDLISIYERLTLESDFQNFFHKILDTIDKANYWEITNCRTKATESYIYIPVKLLNYEDFGYLADRSIGHALGPVAILYMLGYKIESSEIKNLMAFFRHYIIARQLNDDAHDWEEDLKKGHLSPVVVSVLSKWREKNKRSEVSIKKDWKELQMVFWYKVIGEVSQKVLFHIQQAREYRDKINIMQNISPLEMILQPVEQSALKALSEQKETLDFLESYK